MKNSTETHYSPTALPLEVTEQHFALGHGAAQNHVHWARVNGSNVVAVVTGTQFGSSCLHDDTRVLEVRYSERKYNVVELRSGGVVSTVLEPATKAHAVAFLARHDARYWAIRQAVRGC